MLDKAINLKMLMHPVNWLIVWVVLIIASFAWKEINAAKQNGCGCSDIPD